MTSHSYHTQQWQFQSFLSKIGDKTRVSLPILQFNIALEVLPKSVRQEKEIKIIQTQNEEENCFCFNINP